MVKSESTSPGQKIWREAKNAVGAGGTKSYTKVESSNSFANGDFEPPVPKTSGKRCWIAVAVSVLLLVAAAAAVGITVGVNHSHKNGGVESETLAPLAVSAKSITSLCNTTLYPDVCNQTLSSSPGAEKASPQKLVLLAMGSAMQAVNESLSLASHLRSLPTAGNGMEASALDTCIEVLGDSLDQLNTSSYLVTNLNSRNFNSLIGDIQTYMSAALTDEDTCLEGIQEFGAGNGSDQLSGRRGTHVTALLSISLTLVNTLSSSNFNKLDPFHHRRLLSVAHGEPQLVHSRPSSPFAMEGANIRVWGKGDSVL